MADVVKISGGPEEAKIRSVFGPILLPIITLYIYWLVWYFKTNRELADLGKKHGTEELGTSPGKSLLAASGYLITLLIGVVLLNAGAGKGLALAVVLFAFVLIIPALVSLKRHWSRMKAAQRLVGVPESDQGSGVLALLLYLFVGFVYPSYVQHELNKVWARQGAEAPAPVEA